MLKYVVPEICARFLCKKSWCKFTHGQQ